MNIFLNKWTGSLEASIDSLPPLPFVLAGIGACCS